MTVKYKLLIQVNNFLINSYVFSKYNKNNISSFINLNQIKSYCWTMTKMSICIILYYYYYIIVKFCLTYVTTLRYYNLISGFLTLPQSNTENIRKKPKRCIEKKILSDTITPALNENKKQNSKMTLTEIENLEESFSTKVCFEIDELIARIKCIESKILERTNKINDCQAENSKENITKQTDYYDFLQTVIKHTRPTEKILSHKDLVKKY